LREATMGRNLRGVEALMESSSLLVNLADENKHTPLHIATGTDQPEIVRKLLSHKDIDVNPRSCKDLTPILMATRNGKIRALEVLLEDSRVDLDIFDPDGRTIEGLLGEGIKTPLDPGRIAIAHRLFKEARFRQGLKDGTLLRKKAVVFLINCRYSEESGITSLVGPAKDLDIAKQMFEAKGYKIHTLEDEANIEESINTLIDENEADFKELDVLQFIYSGHGIHQTTVEKGKEFGEDETNAEEYFKQKGHIGDCIVNTNGTFCSELMLSLLLSSAVNQQALIGLFFDMCRTETKKMFVKLNTPGLLKQIQGVGADIRIVKIFSAQLGQESAGRNSFLYRICKAIGESFHDGIKFSEMKGFQTEDQKCQIDYAGGENWDQRRWPLE